MVFTSIPENYTPITAPLRYHFDLEESKEVVDVKIIDVDRNLTLAIKRLYNVQSAEVDILPYLLRSFDYRAIENLSDGILSTAEGLFVKVALEIDQVRSAERIYSPYQVVPEYGTLFRSATKQRTISYQEREFIVIYAPNGGSIYYESYSGEEIIDESSIEIEAKPELQLLRISPMEFAEGVDSVIMEVDIEGAFDYLTFNIIPDLERSRRLVWVDSEGLLQFYTFPICSNRRSRVRKQRIETQSGIRVTHSSAEVVQTLVSDYGTAQEMERLGGLLESKHVWLDSEGEMLRVDVLSTESVVRYGGALNSLQVEISVSKREEAEL